MAVAVWFPAPAQASFGIAGFQATAIAEGGAPDAVAGSHPYALDAKLAFNQGPQRAGQPGVPATDGDLRDLRIEEPAGLIENPDALPKCTQALFHTPRSSPFEASLSGESCPAYTQVGVVTLHTSYGGGEVRSFGVFNLVPAPGVPSQLGFAPYGAPITLDSRIRQAQGEYGLDLETHDFPQLFDLSEIELTIWGTPWGVSHNGQRGNCLNEAEPTFGWAKCSVGPPLADPPLAYLALPTSCTGPLAFTATADSWQGAAPVSAVHEAPALEDCETLLFDPRPAGQLSDRRTTSPSGYEFELDNEAETFTDPGFRVPSQVKRAVVSLPEGLTINPSVGAGLGYCTPARYAAETAFSAPGAGCPNAAKIGDFTVQSPLFEETIGGALFLAEPDDPATQAPGAENPFDTLLAVYLVAKAPRRGILVKVAGKVALDPTSGQLSASFDDLPQLPYTNLRVHFREGQRAPLVTPPACGAATTHTELTPWLGRLAAVGSSFESMIEAGIGGGPCPNGSVPPFAPGAKGGTLNPNAGSYSPFYLHLTRTDAEQEITSYSATLPPGLLGKIAGIPYCPEAAIEAAKRETGTEELEHPSCPAASEIGHTVSGYGVGSALTYAPGRLYLAGPYHGSAFSVVAVDSALVGPFDLGVVIVRSAIEVDPRTTQVSIDSAGSDPIPHIIDGIPIHLRDVRVHISRHETTINPTSCEPFSLSSALTGSAEPFTNPRDIEATASVPFQVSNCSSLGFAPKLSFKLRGGTTRGDYPQLAALYRPRPGGANISSATVTLPRAEFLAQNHIRTICTRPQLEAEACPAGSVYGHATAITPLLEAPLRGPVFLRSSENPLPDLVTVLHGQGIRIVLEGRIDSHNGGIRARFEALPDAPVSKFTMVLNGGQRGLLVNERDICSAAQLAAVRLAGHNNKGEAFGSKLQANCDKHRKHRRHRR